MSLLLLFRNSTGAPTLTADLGIYTITGNDVTFSALLATLQCDIGSYLITGGAVTFRYFAIDVPNQTPGWSDITDGSPSWTPVVISQSPAWADAGTNITPPGWGSVATNQSPTWTDVNTPIATIWTDGSLR